MNSLKNDLQQPQIKLSDTQPLICQKCGGQVFMKGGIIRKVSPILTGTGEPAITGIDCIYCVRCGEPVKELLPLAVQTILDEEEKKSLKDKKAEDLGYMTAKVSKNAS